MRLSASSLGCRLFRNNSGAFYNDKGRFIRFGLGNESDELNSTFKFGDYIGVTPILITPDMVGKTVGVFTNYEVKPDGNLPKVLKRAMAVPDSREAGQYRAINLVRDLGGIAWFVSNAEDVITVHNMYLQDLTK